MSEQNSIIKFVAHLQSLGVRLSFVDGELKVKAPKGVLQGALLDELKDKKQQVTVYIQAISQGQKKSLEKIPKVDRTQKLPLSFGQQRLWFLDQLSPDSSFYNMPLVLKLDGSIDKQRFEKSIQILIRRQEILRSNFLQEDDEPYQYIHEQISWNIEFIDFPKKILNDEEYKTLLKSKIDSLCIKSFNLSEGFLFRVYVLQESEQRSCCVSVMHHILGDAWSIEILLKEIVSIYLYGEQSLPPLEIQYADYAAWQRQWLSGERLTQQLEYWKNRLSDVPVLQLPLDRIRPVMESHRGARVSVHIGKDLYKKLKLFSDKNNATLFMTLMAGFQVLLARYSGQQDFAVGLPISNRDREELSGLIGFFVNTMALRSSVKNNISFPVLLQQVKQNMLDAYTHQELPFEQIVDALKVERSTSHAPVFQVMFVLNNSSFTKQNKNLLLSDAQKNGLGELKISLLESEHVSAKFDLNCELTELDESVSGHFEYATDLFDAETIQQMVKHYLNLLGTLIDQSEKNPAHNILALPMFDQTEQNLLLKRSRGVEFVYPLYTNVAGFLQAAIDSGKVAGDVIALRFGGASLSYAQLHERSAQLALYLQSEGLAAQAPVALCMDRSMEMVLGLLAVLKAGSPYLPLDPELPQDRLDFMVADSQAQFVLCTEVHAKRFANSINLDDEAIKKQISSISTNESKLKHTAKPEDLFNIIYTSGSTGKPKGVMVPHAGILNRIQWMQSEYQLQPQDKVLQKTTYSFDVSVWEFIWPLSVGSTLVLAAPEGHKDPVYLSDVIQQEHITHCHFVPSMLQSWLASGEAARAKSLQKVFCSGEALSREAVNQFYEQLPSCELHNLYGPTEASVDVSYWHCEKGAQAQQMVPIGLPVANTDLFVLDELGQVVATGVAGELHIGGVQVAKGYLNRSDLTQKSFIEQHIEGLGTRRLYKTGDLVRQRRDGVIDYLGRIDHQVKIRGYRIELGEIESVLLSHQQIQHAVVVAADVQGQQQLVAYVGSKEKDSGKLKAELKQQLSATLPAYMVPNLIMVLDEMPLLGNGKINRKVLPKAEYEQAQYLAPETETQKVLAGIWQEVLQQEHIGLLDNFFELGGHSLLATRVVSRIKNQLGLSIPLREIFSLPRLGELADYLDNLHWAQKNMLENKNSEAIESAVSQPDQEDREVFEL